MKTMVLALLAVSACFSLNVRFSAKPANYQLYPRDSLNKGSVVLSGKVLEAGYDSVIVNVTRNSVFFNRAAVALAYSGDSAAFSVTASIPAELAEFGFTCLVDAETAAVADSVVAGDVYLIGGQSNSGGIGNSEWREYVRAVVFGATDTGWGYSKEGIWGMELGRLINNAHGVPVCVMCGGVPGADIGTLSRNDSDPMNLNTAYGRLLYRTMRGGVQHDITAIFWYQGESGAGYGAEVSYPVSWDRLRTSWMEDYSGLKKIYILQINLWFSAGAREMREAHRRISHLYDNVRIMSTIGSPGYGGHYSQEGYFEIGERLFRLVSRDFYNSTDTLDIRPPEIQRAYYTSGARDEVALDFDQALSWNGRDTVGGYLKDYFAMNDSDWQAVDTCWMERENRTIRLRLKNPSTATTISYMRDYYDLVEPNSVSGPCLMNRRNVGALTFAKFPLEPPAPGDTAAITGLALSAEQETLSVFESEPCLAVVSYAGAIIDTNRDVVFLCADSFVLRVERNGVVTAMNPGAAEVIAVRGDFRDTLVITVRNAFATVQSVSFRPGFRRLMSGDSMPVDLYGSFAAGIFRLDTMASLQCPDNGLEISGGVIKAVSPSAETRVTAEFAGLRCTLQLAVPTVPAFIRRINFQPRGMAVTAIPGWSIDSAGAYSGAKGFGWVGVTPNTQFSPKISHYLRATWAHTLGDYQVDCPDGNYLIRLCVSQWLWQEPGTVRLNGDTLIKNPQEHAGDGIATEMQIWYADQRVTVTGGAGIRLNIYGGICYLVLVSDDGADLNLVSKDGEFTPDPLYTKGEKAGVVPGFCRAPMACPNPFNPATTVRFGLPAGVSAQYTLFDIRGKKILSENLVRSQTGSIREVTVDFNRRMASGTYFGRLVCSDGKRFVHSLVLIR